MYLHVRTSTVLLRRPSTRRYQLTKVEVDPTENEYNSLRKHEYDTAHLSQGTLLYLVVLNC